MEARRSAQVPLWTREIRKHPITMVVQRSVYLRDFLLLRKIRSLLLLKLLQELHSFLLRDNRFGDLG